MTDEFIYGDITLPLTTATRDERMADYARAYKEYDDQLEFIKERLDYLKQQMLAELPEECGDYEIPLEQGRLKISVPVKYDWDKDMLAEMFQGSELPECVSTGFTVDKRRYDAADDTVKEKLRHALTIKRGSTTVKVLKT